MRILLLHNYYKLRAGEDNYFDSLVELLQKNGDQVILWTRKSSEINNWGKIIKAAINMFFNPGISRELEGVIKKYRPEIAYFHNIYPLITPGAYRIFRRHRIPVLQRVPHYKLICPKGTLFRNNKLCELCVNKRFKYPAVIHGCYHQSILSSLIFSLSFYYHDLIGSFNLVDGYIFQAKFVRDLFLSKTKIIPKEKAYIVPHFVPEYKLIGQKKANYFIFAGRLSEEKGLLQLLEVFKTLPQIKLIVVGDGPLKKEVKQYEKYSNIMLKGYKNRRETLVLMSKAIATIIPSTWYETGPFVLMESFSVGTPVIAPKFGVFIDEVKDGKTGLLYENNNWKDLKDKIGRLFIQKTLAGKMSVVAFKEYQIKYVSKTHYANLNRILKKLIKN